MHIIYDVLYRARIDPRYGKGVGKCAGIHSTSMGR
eukprot:COSAG03_NODE_12984_length_522_cov_26.484634_1_plen_34_part_10